MLQVEAQSQRWLLQLCALHAAGCFTPRHLSHSSESSYASRVAACSRDALSAPLSADDAAAAVDGNTADVDSAVRNMTPALLQLAQLYKTTDVLSELPPSALAALQAQYLCGGAAVQLSWPQFAYRVHTRFSELCAEAGHNVSALAQLTDAEAGAFAAQLNDAIDAHAEQRITAERRAEDDAFEAACLAELDRRVAAIQRRERAPFAWLEAACTEQSDSDHQARRSNGVDVGGLQEGLEGAQADAERRSGSAQIALVRWLQGARRALPAWDAAWQHTAEEQAHGSSMAEGAPVEASQPEVCRCIAVS